MATGARKWLIGALMALAAITLVVIKATTPSHDDASRTVSAETTANITDTSTEGATDGQGTLTVWVPTGVVGSNFWMYLNGHIVNTPPHALREHASLFSPEDIDDDQNRPAGWDVTVYDSSRKNSEFLHIRHGYFLKDETYLRYIKQNLNPVSGDSMGLFFAVNLPIQPGRYTVEVAYLNQGSDSSFPFSISPKYQVSVGDRSRTELRIGVPDDWLGPRPARAVAAGGIRLECNKKPDVSYIAEQMNAYIDDPVVEALTMHKEYSNADGVVTLDLPPAEGGSREYDSVQIRDLADAILTHYYGIDYQQPSQSYIDVCKNSHPEWSLTFDQYGKMINDAQDELRFVHRLAR